MLTEKSLVLPSSIHLTGSLVSKCVQLFVMGSAAAAGVTALEGGYCGWVQPTDLGAAFLCESPRSAQSHDIALGVVAAYFLYLFFGPLHRSHDRVLVFSHHTSWVHAVANWLTRLKGIVNPQTDFQDLINAAAKVTHRYEKNNLIAFVGILFTTLLFGVLMFAPWMFAYLVNPKISLLSAVLAALVVVYIPVVWSFTWLGIRVLRERSHSDHEGD